MTDHPRAKPELVWASGTAYDFFASLFVIHNAETTGLRKAWAAGVRNRLAPDHRGMLSQLVPLVGVPVEWIQGLGPDPDAAAVMNGLDRLRDADAILRLVEREVTGNSTIRNVINDQSFSESDVANILGDGSLADGSPTDEHSARLLLSLFADCEAAGAVFKAALVEYHRRFFAEEEIRIREHLKAALATARRNAARLPVIDLVEELTDGLRMEDVAGTPRLLMVPTFWAGPLTLFSFLEDGSWVIMFSARPRTVSLIPGDSVPDSLLRSLQAVSDQTRLRILRLLANCPRTQADIARELRLRPPTITHHLKILRFANLVRMTESPAGEKTYGSRPNRLREIQSELSSFVED